MARGASAQANNLVNQSSAAANQAGAQQNNAYSQLFPTYSKMARGESTPGTVAANTAAQQSVGGAEAATLGHGAAQAARTGNSAGITQALGAGMRAGSQNLSNLANQNKANEVNQGLKGMSSIYNQAGNQEIGNENVENQGINTGIKAGQNGWFNKLLGGVGAGLTAMA